MPAEAVAEAYSCGQVIFGENYLQDAREKIKQLEPSLQWHFIGHLQSNKARMAAELFQVIETIDRLKIARALDRYAGELEKTLEVLIQVNVGREQRTFQAALYNKKPYRGHDPEWIALKYSEEALMYHHEVRQAHWGARNVRLKSNSRTRGYYTFDTHEGLFPHPKPE